MKLINCIPDDWKDALELHAGDSNWGVHINTLEIFLKEERRDNHKYHPRGKNIFKAFHETPFDEVKVVIIGQDPYPEKKNAMGMSFSVPPDRPIPESLMRIYCAIGIDIGGKIPNNGDLLPWAEQGVLLLNRVLTFSPRADDKYKNRHGGVKWKRFTEAVVIALVNSRRPIRFVLWGTKAKEIKKIVRIPVGQRHEAPHPKPTASPKLAQKFLTCQHFSAVNRALGENNEIEWIPPAPARAARR